MTPEQFDRWKDFSLRMARTCFAGHTNPDPEWIEEQVTNFLDCIDEDDVPALRDWDHSDPYPEESRWYRRTERPCWTCKGSGQQPTKTGRPRRRPKQCTACKGTGTRYEYARPSTVGDIAADWENDHVYHRFHRLATDADHLYRDMTRLVEEDATGHFDYDGRLDTAAEQATLSKYLAGHSHVYLATDPPVPIPLDSEEWLTQWCDQWADPVKACLRAGLDIASAPSAGVCGFTAGHIRRMYPEGVPEWVAVFFSDGHITQVEAVIPGLGIRFAESTTPAPAFHAMPDDLMVWL